MAPTKRNKKRSAQRTHRRTHVLPKEQRRIFANAPEEFLVKQIPHSTSIVDVPDGLPNLLVPWTEQVDLASRLRSHQKDYQKTGNGFFLISAFLITYRCGFYPQQWLLDGLANAFENYWKAPLDRPLDACLGMRVGPGETPAPKAAASRERDKLIAYDMFFLHHHFGLTIEEAAETVRGKLGKYPVLMPSRRPASDPYKTETLVKRYPAWRKGFRLDEGHYHQIAKELTKDQIRGFLLEFPTDDLSEKIKSKLRIR